MKSSRAALFLHQCLCVVVLAVTISGCASARPKMTPPKELAILNLQDICNEYQATLVFDKFSKVVTVNYKDKMIQGIIGSDEVVVNSDKVKISKPIAARRKAILVPADFINFFEKKVVASSPSTGDFVIKKVKEIVIDAGHGGKDPGALGRTGLREKDVVLDVAQRVKSLLEEKGINVVMTRDKDEFISLKDRTEIVSRRKTDLFVSIHANSNPKRAVAGLEIYTLKDLSASEKKEAQRVENEESFYRTVSVARTEKNVQDIISKILYEKKQVESRKLASLISSRVSHIASVKNRGTKIARFFVLRNTLIPAVLIEMGFVTNPKEEKLLSSSFYRQKIAQGIVDGISLYMNE